jgi:UDP-glucose 4-epimerase
MRILVSGGLGFIGRHVVSALCQRPLDGLLVLHRGNLHEVEAFAPEVVINLAWAGVAGLEVRMDEELQKKNIAFNEILFDICKPSCKRWIGVGSQAEINSPDVPYAKYKTIVLNRIKELSEENNVSFAWVRVYSTYGPMDNAKQFLPYLINTLLDGKDVPLTDQNIPWDYLYVADAGKAIAALAYSTEEGIFELGSGMTNLTQDIAKLIRDKINPDLKLLFGAKPCRSVEITKLVADISGFKGIWKPETSLSDGLDRTIDYFKEIGL